MNARGSAASHGRFGEKEPCLPFYEGQDVSCPYGRGGSAKDQPQRYPSVYNPLRSLRQVPNIKAAKDAENAKRMIRIATRSAVTGFHINNTLRVIQPVSKKKFISTPRARWYLAPTGGTVRLKTTSAVLTPTAERAFLIILFASFAFFAA